MSISLSFRGITPEPHEIIWKLTLPDEQAIELGRALALHDLDNEPIVGLLHEEHIATTSLFYWQQAEFPDEDKVLQVFQEYGLPEVTSTSVYGHRGITYLEPPMLWWMIEKLLHARSARHAAEHLRLESSPMEIEWSEAGANGSAPVVGFAV
jgi:hypothetical protein